MRECRPARYYRGMSDEPTKTPFDPSPCTTDVDENVEHAELVRCILGGDRDGLVKLFAIYRPRLWRMVTFRLHPSLQGRIDAEDVMQDAWLRAVDRIDHFLRGWCFVIVPVVSHDCDADPAGLASIPSRSTKAIRIPGNVD